MVVEETEKEIKIILGESINFIFEDNKHLVTVDNINEDTVNITINSKTVKQWNCHKSTKTRWFTKH